MTTFSAADALALCGVDYLVVGPKVLATLKDSPTLQVRHQNAYPSSSSDAGAPA